VTRVLGRRLHRFSAPLLPGPLSRRSASEAVVGESRYDGVGPCPSGSTGTTNVQHGRHQQGQLVRLRFALPRQALLQVSLDPFRPNGDPARSNHRSIPLQKRRGVLESHTASRRRPNTAKLMDGELSKLTIAITKINKKVITDSRATRANVAAEMLIS
jgi:hypothetical protein